MLAKLIPLAVVLCGAAPAAHAACTLQLDGDPEVVAPVREAIDAFRDDGATCVDVRALCSRDDAAIVVDLRDELGRSVQRRFTTPEGAAAFLISWSRRSLPQAGTGLEPDRPPPGAPPPGGPPPGAVAPAAPAPGATPPAPAARATVPPVATPGPRITIAAGLPGLLLGTTVPTTETAEEAAASARRDAGFHPELRAAYITAPLGLPNLDGLSGMLEATALLRSGAVRYGVEIRGVGATVARRDSQNGVDDLRWIELDVEATLGTRWRRNHIQLGVDGFGGFGVASAITASPGTELRQRGLRGGARLVVASELNSSVWLEARLSWDGLRQLGLSGQSDEILRSDRYLGELHLEIGLLWAP